MITKVACAVCCNSVQTYRPMSWSWPNVASVAVEGRNVMKGTKQKAYNILEGKMQIHANTDTYSRDTKIHDLKSVANDSVPIQRLTPFNIHSTCQHN